ncbi:MAG: molybdopterin-dependent oxidoreductase [Maricaulaceae bacterium]|jgi:CO/xanthine dehydrogenase Mo-binding subunit
MTGLSPSLAANPRIETWIRIAPDGRIQVRTGKVEIGQGILTALASIAAGALHVSPERIEIVQADTAQGPDEGLTVGSLSITTSGSAIEAACACVRVLALRAAAAQIGTDTENLTIRDGEMLADGRPTGLTYWTLADELDLTQDVFATADDPDRPDPPPVPRVDLPAKLRGGAFLHDVLPEGVLHACVLRGVGRDALPARDALPDGVELMQTGAFVALVGTDEAQVARAAERAELGISSVRDPQRLSAAALEDLESETTIISIPARRPLRNATATLSATYTRPYLLHGSIGPSCALARWRPECDPVLEVLSHTQGPFALRASLARAFDLKQEAIVVRHGQGAGCYGHNGADDAAADAVFIARERPGRWVRVQWTRAQEMLDAPRGPASIVQISASTDADGLPCAWRIAVRSPTHSQRPGVASAHPTLAEREALGTPAPPPRDVPAAAGLGDMRNAEALYDLPEQTLVHEFVPEPGLRTSALRGLGAHANVFAIESFIDELADAAGADPLAYRLSLLSDSRARTVLERVAVSAGWETRGPSGATSGLGLAFSRYKNAAAYVAVAARIEVEEAVRLANVWACVDCGRVIDPAGARNQIEGGVVQSASWTLCEQVASNHDGLHPSTWEDYPIFRFSDVPEIATEFVSSPNAPLGLGEAAVGPTAAAIGNAVAHALGTRIRDLPVSRENIARTLLANG